MEPVEADLSRLTVLNITEEGRYGGPQQRIADVAVRLRIDHGVDTVVLLPESGSERFQQSLDGSGIEWRSIGLHRLTRDAAHLARYIVFFVSEVLAIRSVIRAVKPDLVHCNGSWQVKGMIAARLAGVRRVWHMNDSFMPGAIRPLFDVVYRLCPPDGVILSSRRTLRYYFGDRRRREPAVARVIPPPVDTARFDPAIAWPNPYPDDDVDRVRVLSVGNINPVKDHGLLIRIAHEINARGRGARFRFYIAGTVFDNQRPYSDSLRALAEALGVSNLQFLGAREDVPALMRHAQLFVCTSQHETGPMVVWEALAMTLPVVSTDVGDLRDLFDAHGCGLVADGRDPAELADLLERVADDAALRAAMGKRGRAAADELDVRHAAERHSECYRKVARC
jgi:glycosyltransferase involved in cell wall biosynthesis